MPIPRASHALSRFTVLDLTRVRSGPTCVRQLADWGANVIKIDALLEDAAGEQPGGPRHGSDFQNLHRNKRAMTLNLKDPRGLEVFQRLAKQADVVVENFRPDVKGKLGIDYESLRKINPRIVYGSISGFGFATESYAASALYTTLASLSGALWRIRRASRPAYGFHMKLQAVSAAIRPFRLSIWFKEAWRRATTAPARRARDVKFARPWGI
jgi:crotonobetainyl-CoA:carnitine CoA-transferase CaiB-like acyl-CoA transferase